MAVLTLSAVVFLVRERGEFGPMARIATAADPRWVVIALLAQVVILVLIAAKYRVILRRLGYRPSGPALAHAHVRRHLVATILPFGGVPSLYGFSRDLAALGVATDDALFAAMLSSVTSEIAFALVLIPVVIGLIAAGGITSPILLGAVVLLGLLGLMLLALAITLRGAVLPSRLTDLVPPRLSQFAAHVRDHEWRIRDLVIPVGLNLGVNIVGVVMLDSSLRAVGQSPSLWIVLSARIVASVVMLVAPVMQGAGVVELSLTGMLQQAGTPAAAALAATLIFRIAQFWFPLALGGLAYLGPNPRRRPSWRFGRAVVGAVVAATFAALLVPEVTSAPPLGRSLFPDGPEIGQSVAIVAAIVLMMTAAYAPSNKRLGLTYYRRERAADHLPIER